MGSLYEPSVRGSMISVIGRRISKRFTTLEGWREIGSGVYAMGSSNIRIFSSRHQFDPEHSQRTGFDFTQTPDNGNAAHATLTRRPSLVQRRPSYEGTIGKAVGSIPDENFFSVMVSGERIQEPYHLYTVKEKWVLVAIAGAAASFPMLTFNTYLPALGRIATDLEISAEATNLTVMAYLMMQGVAPLFWGPLSDSFGRRSVYLAAFSLYVTSCVVLSFSPTYAVLLFFRMAQAASIASTVSVGYNIIRDISTLPECDRFHCFFQRARNGTFVLSPILGGLLSNWMDFRCLFVLLFALATTVLVAIAFLLPETLRSIAGNGSVPLVNIHEPLVWKCKVFGKPAHMNEGLQPAARTIPPRRKFLEPLYLFQERGALLSLTFNGIIFMIWMMVTVSTTTLFEKSFGLYEALVGLAFVPNFLGAIAGSALIGNLLDNDLRRAYSAYKHTHFLPLNTTLSRHSIPADFALGHVRLKRVPIFVIVLVTSLAFYGYTLAYSSLTSLGGWICIPLLLQFLIAATAHAICGVQQTLISDLWLSNDSGAASAASNLARSIFAAIGVAVVEKIMECIRSGPTFLALGLVVMVLVPLPIVQWYFGESWRATRGADRGGAPTKSYPTINV
ncbi:major facilitator superfamily transporter [Paraphaeosphaeria minitans]|uniref:Major facilitator superfamily transporter n=1 Tax=Paraphaeosphaeria minitans TaxID=565426 RepID=A0A9P6G7V1_9PLEO|nr:major facilitator superfamily transporter [Paraphaeosphaeria minitans]